MAKPFLALKDSQVVEDSDGVWEEVFQPSGAVVRALVTPSPEFEAKRAVKHAEFLAKVGKVA